MENASKALLMAASVLIGLLILSLAVYLFASFASTSAELHKENAQKQVDQFNSQFTSLVGKEGLTIYDVVSTANLATETNIYYEYPKRNAIPNFREVKDSYVSVRFVNHSFSGYTGTIEKGYGENTKNITNYYNELIQLDLAQMQSKIDENGTTYQALTEYECDVKISPITRKGLFGNILKKIRKKRKQKG